MPFSYAFLHTTMATLPPPWPPRYAGRDFDPETGLYYMRARYYDPLTSRFITQDPINFASGQTNHYVYVNNSAPNAIDPSGLVANVLAGGVVGGVVGAGGYLISSAINGNFSWDGLTIHAGVGFAAGALAGATFGASLLAMGATSATAATTTQFAAASAASGVAAGALQAGTMSYASGDDWSKIRQNAAYGGAISGVAGGFGGGTLGRLGGISTLGQWSRSQLGKEFGSAMIAGAFVGGLDGGLRTQTVSGTLIGSLQGTAYAAGGVIAGRGVGAAWNRIYDKGVAPVRTSTKGIDEQLDFLIREIPGIDRNQARVIVEGAFSRESSVVFGGSRVRGNFRPDSDLDVGFGSLTKSQARKVLEHGHDVGGLSLERTLIVPGNETNVIPMIHSPEEFFMRSGMRIPPDPRSGQRFSPSGYISVHPDGSVVVMRVGGLQ